MQIAGTVVHGKKQARDLGYPTANIQYQSAEHQAPGVWICWMLIDGIPHQGLSIIGMWSLEDGAPSIEVYLLEVHSDLYGKSVAVSFGDFLRPLESFETMEKLVKQIEKDVYNAKEWFKTH